VSLRILLVCTANQCRSPMAEALLVRRLPAADVSSAGSLRAGQPASEGSVRAMAARGLDLGAHRSRLLDGRLVADADVVLGMARRHVREATVLDTSAFRKTFTVRDLVRRGEQHPSTGGDLVAWLDVIGRGRRPTDVLGDDADEDVADPIGKPDAAYERTAVELEALVDRLAVLLEPFTA